MMKILFSRPESCSFTCWNYSKMITCVAYVSLPGSAELDISTIMTGRIDSAKVPSAPQRPYCGHEQHLKAGKLFGLFILIPYVTDYCCL